LVREINRTFIPRMMERKLTRCTGRIWTRGNVEGTVNRLRAGGFGVRILVGTRHFSLLQNAKTDCGTHQASYSVSPRGSSSLGGREHESHKSSSASLSAEVKNEWNYTFTPPMRLYGMYVENFYRIYFSVGKIWLIFFTQCRG